MAVNVHARNVHLDRSFKDGLAAKVDHATRFLGGSVGEVDLEVTEESNPRRADGRFRVEVTTLAAGHTLRVEAAASTPESAVDQAVDRLESQLRKLKDRLVHRSRNHREPPLPDSSADDEEEGPQIVRVKQFVMKPMTPDEAILEMDMLGHGFFLFENAETGMSSVVYRRSDGGYGLIEPA